MQRRVLVSCIHLQETFERYEDLFRRERVDVDLPPVTQQLTEQDLLPIIGRYHGIIAGDDELTATVLRRADQLSVISRWGVGIDNVDLAFAAEAGIEVTNTPGMFSDEVADVAMGYMILLVRGLHRIDAAVRSGRWLKIRGTSLAGKTLGIVGLGAIGRALAERAVAFGMSVLGYDRGPKEGPFVQLDSLDDLLRRADVVSLHCDLNPSSRSIIGGREISLMKPGAFLVNTSRGGLVVEEALTHALREGRLGGAALDVFATEPLPSSHPLVSMEGVILGSHNASNTIEAVLRTNELAIENLFRHLPEGPR